MLKSYACVHMYTPKQIPHFLHEIHRTDTVEIKFL